MFGPGGSFFVWVRGMGGGTNGQSASGAAAGAEFLCGVLGDGVASALRWMCVDVACVRVSEVCWFGFEGGLLGTAWVLEESGLYV